jgi:SAM-dependent methyltransferase
MESKDVINQWDIAAKSYAENQRSAPNNLTNWQIIKDMVGDIKKKVILDAGCGDGFFSNELSEMGAIVTACDGSKELIKIAKSDFKSVKFDVCDLTEEFVDALPEDDIRKQHQKLNFPYTIALICYEKPSDFCHRHLVADWLNENGIECKEWEEI